MRVLIAEDDTAMRDGLTEILEGEGYDVVAAADGAAALARWTDQRADFVLLDIMMPRRSGYDVCREIRGTDRNVPIVFLSAKSEEIDKVLGLELGADDFVMKPFGVRELVARVRAISRRCYERSAARPAAGFAIGGILVSPAELRATLPGGAVVELSLREVKLMATFAAHPNTVLDRDTLFRECWGVNKYPNTRTLDQHIAKLRKKIERDPKEPVLIRTVRGVGYRHDKELAS
ncbi:MAG: response regulator transcription factor [Deltaproteobacteria bacterium]|nr:response regulator transcription factor [Deltaproteobacteria bacterium]